MQSSFHKNRIYRVKEQIDRVGRKVYTVQAAKNRFSALFDCWTEYVKENDTLDEAISQIETIDKARLVKEKIVHRERKK